jgi:hypothetical protein
VFDTLFGKDRKNVVSLAQGITIIHNGADSSKIINTIEITKDATKEYKPELGLTVVANIIAAWLVYRLTGKVVKLEFNDKLVDLKKTAIRNTLEKELMKSNLFQ